MKKDLVLKIIFIYIYNLYSKICAFILKLKENFISINEYHQIMFLNISNLIEESLKQVDEYRFKIKNSLIKQISNENFKQLNEIKDKNLFKFPPKPNIPIVLIEKSNENRLTNLITNSNLNKFNYFQDYLNRLLEIYFNNNQIYENFQSKLNILSLSEQLKDFFKQIYQRYKIIVEIIIQQHLDQSIFIASKSLWDKNTDYFLQQTFFKKNIFIIIIVFFIYKE